MLVDNAPGCAKLQPGNALLVEDYLGVDVDPGTGEVDDTLVRVGRVLGRLVGEMAGGGQGPPHGGGGNHPPGGGKTVAGLLQALAEEESDVQRVTVCPPMAQGRGGGDGRGGGQAVLTTTPQEGSKVAKGGCYRVEGGSGVVRKGGVYPGMRENAPNTPRGLTELDPNRLYAREGMAKEVKRASFAAESMNGSTFVPINGYNFSTMMSAPPQGAYFRVKRGSRGA